METAPALAAAVPAGASAYLVTVDSDGRPHAAPASVVVADEPVVVVRGPGRRSRANVRAGSVVTVLWSPPDPAEHTLIVDGVGEPAGDDLVVRPTRAVLHRPAPEGSAAAGVGDACTADCVEVALDRPV